MLVVRLTCISVEWKNWDFGNPRRQIIIVVIQNLVRLIEFFSQLLDLLLQWFCRFYSEELIFFALLFCFYRGLFPITFCLSIVCTTWEFNLIPVYDRGVLLYNRDRRWLFHSLWTFHILDKYINPYMPYRAWNIGGDASYDNYNIHLDAPSQATGWCNNLQ